MIAILRPLILVLGVIFGNLTSSSISRFIICNPAWRHQFADTLAQPTHHLGHRQHHLHCRIPFNRHLVQPFHRSLRFNLICFISDSPFFSDKKITLSLSTLRAGESLLPRFTGHPHFHCEMIEPCPARRDTDMTTVANFIGHIDMMP